MNAIFRFVFVILLLMVTCSASEKIPKSKRFRKSSWDERLVRIRQRIIAARHKKFMERHHKEMTSSKRITNLEISGTCPAECVCRSPTEIKCISKSLLEIPSGISSSVERIFLGHNNIFNISEESLGEINHNLQQLHIPYNKIGSIPNGVFSELKKLQILRLSHNEVEGIRKAALHGLDNLERLYLDGNRISFIHPLAFRGLSKLRFLQLEGNRLSKVHRDLFITTEFHKYFKHSSIRSLDLSQNNFTRLPRHVFDHMTEVETVILSQNQWDCSCHSHWLKVWMENESKSRCGQPASLSDDCPICNSPDRLKGRSLHDTPSDSFVCIEPGRPTTELNIKDLSSIETGNDLAMFQHGGYYSTEFEVEFNSDSGIMLSAACNLTKAPATLVSEGSTFGRTYLASFEGSFACYLDSFTGGNTASELLRPYRDQSVTLNLAENEESRFRVEEKSYSIQVSADDVEDSILFSSVSIASESEFLLQSDPKITFLPEKSSGSDFHLIFNTSFEYRFKPKSAKFSKKPWVFMRDPDPSTVEVAIVQSNKSLVAKCKAVGQPKPDVAWVVPSGKLISSGEMSNRYSVNPSGRLLIREASSADSGIYRCLALVSNAKSPFDSTEVEVAAMKYKIFEEIEEDFSIVDISPETQQVSVEEGHTWTHDCAAESLIEATIAWILPNNQVVTFGSSGRRGRVKVLLNGTITVPDFKVEDEGLYRCVGVNVAGEEVLPVYVSLPSYEDYVVEDTLPNMSETEYEEPEYSEEMDPAVISEDVFPNEEDHFRGDEGRDSSLYRDSDLPNNEIIVPDFDEEFEGVEEEDILENMSPSDKAIAEEEVSIIFDDEDDEYYEDDNAYMNSIELHDSVNISNSAQNTTDKHSKPEGEDIFYASSSSESSAVNNGEAISVPELKNTTNSEDMQSTRKDEQSSAKNESKIGEMSPKPTSKYASNFLKTPTGVSRNPVKVETTLRTHNPGKYPSPTPRVNQVKQPSSPKLSQNPVEPTSSTTIKPISLTSTKINSDFEVLETTTSGLSRTDQSPEQENFEPDDFSDIIQDDKNIMYPDIQTSRDPEKDRKQTIHLQRDTLSLKERPDEIFEAQNLNTSNTNSVNIPEIQIIDKTPTQKLNKSEELDGETINTETIGVDFNHTKPISIDADSTVNQDIDLDIEIDDPALSDRGNQSKPLSRDPINPAKSKQQFIDEGSLDPLKLDGKTNFTAPIDLTTNDISNTTVDFTQMIDVDGLDPNLMTTEEPSLSQNQYNQSSKVIENFVSDHKVSMREKIVKMTRNSTVLTAYVQVTLDDLNRTVDRSNSKPKVQVPDIEPVDSATEATNAEIDAKAVTTVSTPNKSFTAESFVTTRTQKSRIEESKPAVDTRNKDSVQSNDDTPIESDFDVIISPARSISKQSPTPSSSHDTFYGREQGRIQLHCVPFATSGSWTFTWTLPDGDVYSRPGRIVSRDWTKFVHHNGSLSVSKLKKTNEGNYTCIALDVAKNVEYENSINLMVFERLRILNPSHEFLRVKPGRQLMLPCDVTGYPRPVVTWKTPWGRIVRYSNFIDNLKLLWNNTLQIFNVRPEEKGTFQCIAKSGSETRMRMVSISMTSYPPSFIGPSHSLHYVVQGGTIKLECKSEGYPEPSIYWLLPSGQSLKPNQAQFSGSRRVPKYRVMKDGELRLTGAEKKDQGVYHCVITNRLGRSASTVRLMVGQRSEELN